jgi:hypothetical protein
MRGLLYIVKWEGKIHRWGLRKDVKHLRISSALVETKVKHINFCTNCRVT